MEDERMRAFPEMKKKLAFGMMRLPMVGEVVDYAQVNEMVDAFLAKGFNYFDTATPYIGGQSETAVRDCLAKRHAREEFLLTDKLSPNLWENPEDIAPLVDRQLANCGVEYFDFYLMHAMNADRHKRYMDAGAYDIVQKLKSEGKIRHMGISFHHTADVLDQILTDRPDIEVVQLQFNYADMEDPRIQSRKCYEVCRKHGKPVLVMEPVKGGALANLPAEDAAGQRIYALVTVRLTQGRTLSVEDFSLNALGGLYRCIAIRENDGAFNAANWHFASVSPAKKYGMLFALQIPAGQNYNNVKFDLVCNAPGKWNRTAIPFTDRRSQAFSPASAISNNGRFPVVK